MLDYLGDFFSSLINGLFTFVGFVINLILTPINSLISTYLPDLNEALEFIDYFFNDVLTPVTNWGLSWFGVPQWCTSILIGIWIFIFTVPLLVLPVKLALKWFNSLKVG